MERTRRALECVRASLTNHARGLLSEAARRLRRWPAAGRRAMAAAMLMVGAAAVPAWAGSVQYYYDELGRLIETVAADVGAKPASKQVSLAGVLAGKPRQFLDGRSHREGRPGASLPPADTDLTKSSTNLHAASGSPGEKCGRFTTKGRISWLKLDDGS